MPEGDDSKMSQDEKIRFEIIVIRGRKIMLLPETRMPWIYFHPDTPEKVVWMDPT